MTLVQDIGDRIVGNVEKVIIGKHREVQLAFVAM
ncbi:MAG: AAA family ATPase, partial [Chloroflexi bacterium]|nr:AAA family ATPase [Chloroflexota bacterium]